MENYRIENGKIMSKGAVPNPPRWYCDDLVAMENDIYGISKVEYFNRSTEGIPTVFFNDMWGGMKFYLKSDASCFSEALKNTIAMPYGFSGIWETKLGQFEYERRIINNTIVTTLKTGENVLNGTDFVLEFTTAFCLKTQSTGDFRLIDNSGRKWDEWKFCDNALKIFFSETKKVGETHVAIGSEHEIRYEKRSLGGKYILTMPSLLPNTEYSFYISFDETDEKAVERLKTTIKEKNKFICVQNERYRRAGEKAPILESPYKSLNNFFELVPLYHESCKVQSIPGAVRAKTNCYWVWGWDGMSSSYAYAYLGDNEFMGELMELYMKTADENGGIVHCFNRDMTHKITSMYSAQGFYLSLMYQYYINGGDITPYYDFAKKLLNTILSHEVGDTGLCDGWSLFPDFREAIMENGEDISTFNNSSLYCGVAAMGYIAKEVKDDETYRKTSEFTERTRKNFSDIFFDEEKGYFVSSVDKNTLEKRPSYTSMAIKWDNTFCRDLVDGKNGDALRFFEENFVKAPGILPLPRWGKSYDFDSNQAHSHWPATCEYYARLINMENRKELTEQFVGWISYWTDKLMCPEGIDCYTDTEVPATDYWTSLNGAWQAYSMRAWYEAVIHSVVGVEISSDGLNIYPYSGKEMSLIGLNFDNKKLDIHMKGSGSKVKSVSLDGKSLGAVYKIEKELLKEHSVIEVVRCN